MCKQYGSRFTMSTGDVLKATTEFVYQVLDRNGKDRVVAVDISTGVRQCLACWPSMQDAMLRCHRTNILFTQLVPIKSCDEDRFELARFQILSFERPRNGYILGITLGFTIKVHVSICSIGKDIESGMNVICLILFTV